MRNLLKNLFETLPVFVKIQYINFYESYNRRKSFNLENKEALIFTEKTKERRRHTKKKSVLIYHISGMSYGGTEKNLQIVANGLVSEYDVYYMYSDFNAENNRLQFMHPGVKLIRFTYTSKDDKYPYYVHNMNPHIKNVIDEKHIDMIIVSDVGQTNYPIINILDIPILMINNFGGPTTQKNIVHINYVSETVRKHAQLYTGKLMRYSVLNTPTTDVVAKKDTTDLRKKLGISEDAFVIGRIGRNSDNIFDPIGINAYKRIVDKYPDLHFIIVSPPPKLEKIILEEKIPRVHIIQPTNNEKEIWAFHYALDTLAHFRYDGETLGLNIAESMMVGNPIITHVSHVWNAHLDYLKNESFSRIAKMDDYVGYASFIEELIEIKKGNLARWESMKQESKRCGEKLFTRETYMEKLKVEIAKHI